MTPIDPNPFEQRYRVTLLCYWAQVSASLLYAAVGWFVFKTYQGLSPESREVSLLRNLFLFLSVGLIPLSLWFRLRFLRSKKMISLLDKLVISSILCNSFGDVVAILGFVLVALTRHFAEFYPFLILALIIFFFNFPNKEEWKRWLNP